MNILLTDWITFQLAVGFILFLLDDWEIITGFNQKIGR